MRKNFESMTFEFCAAAFFLGQLAMLSGSAFSKQYCVLSCWNHQVISVLDSPSSFDNKYGYNLDNELKPGNC